MRPSASTAPRSRGGMGLEKPLLWGLLSLLLIYSFVTVATYHKISNQDVNQAISSITPSTAASAEQRQQQPVRGAMRSSAKETGDLSISQAIEKLQHTFPIMVGSDTQVIPHPGLSLIDPTKVPEGLSTTIVVPKFFDESHGHVFGKDTIREYLGNGERLLTPQEAATIGSFDKDGHETIYCSVASYRDPECTETVEDIYARAEFPERIRVAILDQRTEGDAVCSEPTKPCEEAPDQALCKYKHLIEYFPVDARLAVGPVFARHLAHRHYRGEYFAMQVDSHVRFTKHWDSDIIGQWKSAKNEMAVLSTYLSDIIGRIDPVTFEGTDNGRPIMCKSDYEGQGANRHLRHGQQPEGPSGIHGEPTLHPFWAAGFSFARGHFVIQVPYDQYLPMVFQGEEISIGLRGFTYGYDYYAPERGVCFHMYAVKENAERRHKIPLFWENSNIYSGVGVQAMKRLNSIIGMEHYPDSEWKHDDEKKYGLGQIRRPEKFFTTFGIHLAEHKVEDHLCRFVGKPMMKEFKPALRENGMGLDYDKITYVFRDPDKKTAQKKK